jgi:hypothetical protein
MKKAIFLFLIVLICGVCKAQKSYDFFCTGSHYNYFGIDPKESTTEFGFYVGKTAIFYEPVNDGERKIKLKKIKYGVPYTIQDIQLVDNNVTFLFVEKNAEKAKPIKIKCENRYKNGKGDVFDLPLYIKEHIDEASSVFVGKTLYYNGELCSIIGFDWMVMPGFLTDAEKYSCFVYENPKTGNRYKETMKTAFSGSYRSTLAQVEKPSDESIRYGETTIVSHDSITRYSYIDNVIEIVIFGNKEEFSFDLKNVSDNSIKVVWNEAVFVGLDRKTSKIMHTGVKYSQKDGDQPATVIIRGARISDVAVPICNVRYSSWLKEWVTDSMYPKKEGNDGQVRLMLPIQIKETINEYIFVFDIKYELEHPELYK